MPTHNTVSVVITDEDSMTAEAAGQLATAIQDVINKCFAKDPRVTSLSPAYTADTCTITIT